MKLKEDENGLYDVDAYMDERFGTVGSVEREEFRKNANLYCVGDIIKEARKAENVTQSELADRIQSTKSYVSRIEHGTVDISVGLFFKILTALGMQVDITKK